MQRNLVQLASLLGLLCLGHYFQSVLIPPLAPYGSQVNLIWQSLLIVIVEFFHWILVCQLVLSLVRLGNFQFLSQQDSKVNL